MASATSQTSEFDFFQRGGADETLALARVEFEATNPGRVVKDIRFYAADPGRPGEGRWVTFKVDHIAV